MRSVYLNGNDYNQLGLKFGSGSDEKVNLFVIERQVEIKRQKRYNCIIVCIRKSRYNAKYEMINTMDLPVYLRSESSFKDAKRLTRDAEIEETKFWAGQKEECIV